MTQNEAWIKKYNEVVAYVETNKRNPSKHSDGAANAVALRKSMRGCWRKGENSCVFRYIGFTV